MAEDQFVLVTPPAEPLPQPPRELTESDIVREQVKSYLRKRHDKPAPFEEKSHPDYHWSLASVLCSVFALLRLLAADAGSVDLLVEVGLVGVLLQLGFLFALVAIRADGRKGALVSLATWLVCLVIALPSQ